MLKFEPWAAGSGSEYADHCAMLPNKLKLKQSFPIKMWLNRQSLQNKISEDNMKKVFLVESL